MKKVLSFIVALTAAMSAVAQTLNVQVGEVTYQIPAAQAGEMLYQGGSTLTILDKVYTIADIDRMYIDGSTVTDNAVSVAYNGNAAEVKVPGTLAKNLTVVANDAHVTIVQSADVASEITYTLSGQSDNGSFYMDGKLKATLVMNGLTLNNPDSAAINIRNGKRINVELVDGTENTLTDGVGGPQKGCFAVKGHTEFKGGGTLNITGRSAHAFWGKEYVEVKKTVGTINILGAVGDGFNVNQYFQMNGGTVNIAGVGDDGIQVSYKTDDNDVIEEDAENTGSVTIKGGTLHVVTTGDGVKGIKAEADVNIMGGSINIEQTGGIVVEGDDVSYSTAIKADGNINISGSTLTINNTAEGGKGLSADGDVNIDESNATTVINITANGNGGVADIDTSGDTGTTASYKVYVSIPTTGGGGPGGGNRAWTNVYLYKSDGTLVQKLTNTVTKSTGYYTTTFYYYDFQQADNGTYNFQSDNYTSGGGWGGGTTYTIKSAAFSGPTSGADIYLSISNSYTTSGSTRTYSITNVTSTYAGSDDLSEDSGKSYNAAGIKADGNVTISGGTITVKNSGEMSKSIKSKATTTINGGNITLIPSGGMRVVNSDASYSMGVKAVDYIQNDGTVKITASGTASRGISSTNITTNGGTLTITNSAGGQSGTSDDYTAKGLKADADIALNAGTISITMTGNGGKGIKCDGAYTQGTEDGNGPTLTVKTTGSRFGNSSGGGWGWGPGSESSGGSAKAIKVQGTITLNGGTTEVKTTTDGAEGLESKTSITVNGGQHYFECYDDCINSSGKIFFNGGVTVCYSNGNDAIDSNAGQAGAITIGDGVVLAYSTRGAPEEGFDCDNNSYIRITGQGIAISAGANQGGGGGWGGSSTTISNAAQGYYFCTNNLSYAAGQYYSLLDANGNNLVTYSFPVSFSSSLSLITAKGMTKGGTYQVKYGSTAPTDATTAFHGVYLGSSAQGSNFLKMTSSSNTFTAQ